ncbi:MAG: UvrD-helicase domain-containing protein [Planctomycetota bacterium]|nr:UvrD-helicase domain-containing protein [Planctomycetota bacterium]
MNERLTPILQGLNPPQREAVESIEGPLLILAGAGSGKTRVVTCRIANLIAHGVRPWQILAITFTNKAAGEMRRRVEDLVGVPGVWLSTFHSFCARLLRREASVLGLHPDYTIYDEDDAERVVKDVGKSLNLDDKRYSPRRLRSTLSQLKSQGLRAADIPGANFHERIVKEVYEQYEGALTRNQALDFDDLLLKAVELLRDHEDVRERYRDRFRYVLVDEYQDTNGCQYQLVKLLGLGHRNVCATGDPDQSIYAWRGADVRNILSFEQDFPEAKVVRLEQNYRSTKHILAVAQAVIEHNTQRKERGLWTENAEGAKVALKVVADGELEAHEVVRQVGRLEREGRRYSEMAVFYRTNAQSRAFEDRLIHEGIPYQLVGGTPFYERKEVKDALAYLRLMANPKDDVSFARVINTPRRGIGDKTVDLVAKHAGRLGCSMLEALDRTEWMEAELKPKALKDLYAFARTMDALRQMPAYPVREALLRVLEATGLQTSLEQAEEDERVQNLEQLVSAAAVYDEENRILDEAGAPDEPGATDGLDEAIERPPGIAGFLENAALVAPTDKFDPSADRLTLMTLHMAKGLEFPVVFIAGMEDGLLPMLRSSDADDDGRKAKDALEEERRLFYVGVTRAREKLTLLRAAIRARYGRSEPSVPSPFLEEIPEALLEVEDESGGAGSRAFGRGFGRLGGFGGYPRARAAAPQSGSKRGPASSFEEFEAELDAFAEDQAAPTGGTAVDLSDSQVSDGGFEVGDRVRHPKFGAGRIEAFSGAGLSRKVTVYFKDAGKKQLLLSLSRLQRA